MSAQRKPRARHKNGQFKKQTNYLKSTVAFLGNWMGKASVTSIIVCGSLLAVQSTKGEVAPTIIPQVVPIVDPTIHFTKDDYRQISCLAQNIYFEARGESVAGMEAVAHVTLNRVHSGLYPDSICQVVYQRTIVVNDDKSISHKGCQFSWYCDGTRHTINDKERWLLSYTVAYNAVVHEAKLKDNTGGATYYHADYVKPSWSKKFQQTTRIGQHVFYKAM